MIYVVGHNCLCDSAGVRRRPQWIISSRLTGFHQPLRESIHICVTLRSLQTLSEADAEQ